MNGPGLVGATLQVGDLGLRQALRSKLLIGVGLTIAFAVGIAFVAYQYGDEPRPGATFQAFQLLFMSPVVVPFIALLLGTNAMAAEREGGTLAYLFTRPFPRAAVVLGKSLAAILIANAAVLVCALLVWIVTGASAHAQLAGGLLALLLECTALTAVFALLGTLLARSLVVGLVYAIGYEGVIGNVVSTRSGTTVTYHARNLLSEWSAKTLRPEMDLSLPGGPAESVLLLLAVAAGALAVACVVVEKREYGLKDKPKGE